MAFVHPPKKALHGSRCVTMSRLFTKDRIEAFFFFETGPLALPYFDDVPGLTKEAGLGLSTLVAILRATVIEFGVFLSAVWEKGGTTVIEAPIEFLNSVGGFVVPIHVDLFASHSDHVLNTVSSLGNAVCGTAGTGRQFTVLVIEPFHGSL